MRVDVVVYVNWLPADVDLASMAGMAAANVDRQLRERSPDTRLDDWQALERLELPRHPASDFQGGIYAGRLEVTGPDAVIGFFDQIDWSGLSAIVTVRVVGMGTVQFWWPRTAMNSDAHLTEFGWETEGERKDRVTPKLDPPYRPAWSPPV